MKKQMSHVALIANQRIDSSLQMMQHSGMTVEQWNHLLFEAGCAFVERWILRLYQQECLLQNPELAFWDWWLAMWMDDDQELLRYRIQSLEQYHQQKEVWVQDKALYTLFEQFLKRNRIFTQPTQHEEIQAHS